MRLSKYKIGDKVTINKDHEGTIRYWRKHFSGYNINEIYTITGFSMHTSLNVGLDVGDTHIAIQRLTPHIIRDILPEELFEL